MYWCGPMFFKKTESEIAESKVKMRLITVNNLKIFRN